MSSRRVMDPTSSLTVFEDELVQQGYQPGTPTFQSALLARKVTACQVMQNVTTCRDCGRFDYCETAKAYLCDKKYNKPAQRREVVITDTLPDWMFSGVGDDNGDRGDGSGHGG